MFRCEHTQNECVYTPQKPSECEHTRHTQWAPGKATVDHVYQSTNSESACYLTKVIGECATLRLDLGVDTAVFLWTQPINFDCVFSSTSEHGFRFVYPPLAICVRPFLNGFTRFVMNNTA